MLQSNKKYAVGCGTNAFIISPMETSTWEILHAFFFLVVKVLVYHKSLASNKIAKGNKIGSVI